MKLKNLNSDDFIMEIVEDLGTIEVNRGKPKIRFAKFKCNKCFEPMTKAVDAAKRSVDGYCMSCASSKKATKHNDSQDFSTPYRVWAGIKQRCYNNKCVSYKYYGAVGVTMCKEWKEDYAVFKKWCLDNGWKVGLQVDKDRLSRNLGVTPPMYSPATCCILSNKENNAEKVYVQKRKLPRNIYKTKAKFRPYMVQIKIDNKPIYIGSYSTIEEAKQELTNYKEKHDIR